jgi:hypothetical protein
MYCFTHGENVVGNGGWRASSSALTKYLECAGELRVTADVAAEFKLLKLVGDTRQRRKSYGVTDLLHGGWVAVLVNVGSNHVEDELLFSAQSFATFAFASW